MNDIRHGLRLVTRPGLAYPMMAGTFLVAAIVAGWFFAQGRFLEAAVVLLVEICLIGIGIADLIGELILLGRQALAGREQA